MSFGKPSPVTLTVADLPAWLTTWAAARIPTVVGATMTLRFGYFRAGAGPPHEVPEPQGHRRPDHRRNPGGRPGRQGSRPGGHGQAHRTRGPERHEAVPQGRH